jgi:uncharacterized protein (TIGR03437 family)
VSTDNDIILAGRVTGTTDQLSGNLAVTTVPFNAPLPIPLPLKSGERLRFYASGRIGPASTPDGNIPLPDSRGPFGSLGGISGPAGALYGVFLDNNTGSATPPPTLFYSEAALRNETAARPLIRQPFFIGTGATQNGVQKEFVIPPGATSLYVGVWLGRGNKAVYPGSFLVTAVPVGSAQPQPVVPMVNAAGFGAGALAPGSVAALFGSAFSNETLASAVVPLPDQLGQTQVFIDDLAAPLFFVSREQINFQIPWEASTPKSQLVVIHNGVPSTPVWVDTGSAKPGIFVSADQAIVVDAGTGSLITSSAPAAAGSVITIYSSGIGRVLNQPASGDVPGLQLARAVEEVFVLFNQTSVKPLFAGLAPGMVGVNQINVTIPEAVSPPAVRLRLAVQGITSNAVDLPVR